MRIQPIEPPLRETQKVKCANCNDWIYHGDGLADLDGEPYKAFYHRDCAPSEEVNTLTDEQDSDRNIITGK